MRPHDEPDAHTGNEAVTAGASLSVRPVARRVALAANVLAMLVALVLIWAPEVRLYWVGATQVRDDDVGKARTVPATAVLDEVGHHALAMAFVDPRDAHDRERLRQLGEGVLAGQVQFTRQPAARLPFPFRASHLDVGLPGEQLKVAAMGTVHLLLDAYAATQDRKFLDAAIEETLAFDRVDRWRLVPRGLLWNDHALALRAAILARLWSFARARAELRPETAHVIVALAERTGLRLARPELFNARTNHGVMQSIGLIQIAVAFPTLPQADYFKSLGCGRIAGQLRHYIDPEGPVLEHSAGYHELGRDLLTKSMRLFELGGCAVPPEWPQLLERVTKFSRLLLRPDGTLPVFGNTEHALRPLQSPIDTSSAPEPPRRIHAASGFSVNWRGVEAWPDPARLSQTVLTWSNFPSRAHKHADDMAMVVWADGRPWLTNSGYWPYGVDGYDAANGWRGSNAPHFEGESPRAQRKTVLLGAGNSKSVTAIDLERQLSDGGRVRRQVVEIDGGTWIVLDSATATQDRSLTTLWTTMPETTVQAESETQFLLRSTDSGSAARLSFAGRLTQPPAQRIGQYAPFGGWIVRDGKPTPAPAIEAQYRAASGPVATVLHRGAQRATLGFEESEPQPTRWTISISSDAARRVVTRTDNLIVVRFGDGREERIELAAVADAEFRRGEIVSAYEAAVREYPGVRELTEYRYMLTELAVLLLAAQEVVLAIVRRRFAAGVAILRAAAALSWLAFGSLAAFWYLR